MMLINGIATEQLQATDRGLQYGDGLFETVAVVDGQPRLWREHMARLAYGCQRLQIALPDSTLLRQEAQQLCADQPRAILKIIITRGSGGRGYRIPETTEATRLLAIHPWPAYPDSHYQQGITLMVCHTRLGCNPALAGIKHLNRLEQVLARSEWQGSDIDEGLMRDLHGDVIEGTMSNLFIIEDETLITPDLAQCGVNGVMRERVLALAAELGITTRVETVSLTRLKAASACFITNSIIGLWPVRALGGINYEQGKIMHDLIDALVQTLDEPRLATVTSNA